MDIIDSEVASWCITKFQLHMFNWCIMASPPRCSAKGAHGRLVGCWAAERCWFATCVASKMVRLELLNIVAPTAASRGWHDAVQGSGGSSKVTMCAFI